MNARWPRGAVEAVMKDGGPAFPLPVAEIHGIATHAGEFGQGMTGMSLRDWFSGQALVGVLANLAAMDAAIRSANDCCQRFARDCYRMADAMLAEREK